MLLVSQPVSIKQGLRTADYRLGIKYGLGIKSGLENTDWVYIKHELPVGIMYRSNPSFNIPPPRPYPRHMTPLPSQGGGNLIIRVFQGVGILIPMH